MSAADIANDAARSRMDEVAFIHAANALLAAIDARNAAVKVVQEAAIYGSNNVLAAANALSKAASDLLIAAADDMAATRQVKS